MRPVPPPSFLRRVLETVLYLLSDHLEVVGVVKGMTCGSGARNVSFGKRNLVGYKKTYKRPTDVRSALTTATRMENGGYS